MPLYPGLMSRQQMAVGGPIKRRKPAEEVGLKAYLQGMAPIARAEEQRKKMYAQWLSGQEREAEEHAEAMALEREKMEAEREAAEERERISQENLELGRKAQRETEKQAKRGLILQGTSLALQAYPLIFGGQDITMGGPTTPHYGGGGSESPTWSTYPGGEGGEGGGGSQFSFDLSETCICLTFLYGMKSPQVRYAKVFCGRFMDLATLLGYYQVAAKIVLFLKRHKGLISSARKYLAGPFYNFMLWKLGRREKASIFERQWSRFFLWLCKKQEQRRKTIMILPCKFERCINMVKGR